MTTKQDTGTDRKRLWMGPLATSLAVEQAGSDDFTSSHLEAGILALQGQVRREGSGPAPVTEPVFRDELDAVVHDLTDTVSGAFSEVHSALQIHTHTLNLIRDMIRVYGEATNNGDVAGAIADLNKRLDQEITSIRATYEFRDQRRASIAAERDAREEEEREEPQAADAPQDGRNIEEDVAPKEHEMGSKPDHNQVPERAEFEGEQMQMAGIDDDRSR